MSRSRALSALKSNVCWEGKICWSPRTILQVPFHHLPQPSRSLLSQGRWNRKNHSYAFLLSLSPNWLLVSYCYCNALLNKTYCFKNVSDSSLIVNLSRFRMAKETSPCLGLPERKDTSRKVSWGRKTRPECGSCCSMVSSQTGLQSWDQCSFSASWP